MATPAQGAQQAILDGFERAQQRKQELEDEKRKVTLKTLQDDAETPQDKVAAIDAVYHKDPGVLKQHVENLTRKLTGKQPLPVVSPDQAQQGRVAPIAARGQTPEQREVSMQDRQQRAQLALQQLKGQQATQKTSQSRPVPGYSEAQHLETAKAAAEGGAVYLGADGKPIDVNSIPPGNVLVPIFQGGGQSYWTVATDKGRYETAGNQRLYEPAVGAPNQNAPSIGPVRVPTTRSSTATDSLGVTTNTSSTTTPQGQPAPRVGASPGAGVSPSAQRTSPGLAPRKPAASHGTASSPKVDPHRQLDASGHIPPSAGNPGLVQAANSIIDGMDVDKLPIPQKDRGAAMALAAEYGYQGQGTFTPQQKIMINEAGAKLDQLANTPYLSVLDNGTSRAKIAAVLSASDPKSGTVHNVIASQIARSLTPAEAGFIRDYNAAVGVISGLGPVTRGNRTTEASVQRLMTELPSVFQAANSKDAKARIKQLTQEIDLAKNPSNATSLGPKAPAQSNVIVVSPEDMK